MNFEENVKTFITRVEKLKNNILTEEATKTSIIMPFFQILGYDIFNPSEFIPEYTADVGIKKGEKVDYAIVLNDIVSILIEAKSINEELKKHDSQLFRYFGTSSAKFAILTNGIIYNFYTDLDEKNKMDTTPFLTINLLNLKDTDLAQLKKFTKENFDIENIVSSASNLKYISNIKSVLKEEFNTPSDDFIKSILNLGIYDGIKTQTVIDKYRDIIKNSISSYINECVNERLKQALNSSSINVENTIDTTVIEEKETGAEIITTQEELESFYIVKSILSEIVEPDTLYYKDTYSYFGILLDNKVTKWICRVFIKENAKYIIIPDNDKNEVRYDIQNVNELYKLKDNLIARLNCLK